MATVVSAPDHTQAKSGLVTRAKFLGPDDVSFWNAGIPIKSVLAQLVTCESHDILSLVPKSGPGTRLSRKMEAKRKQGLGLRKLCFFAFSKCSQMQMLLSFAFIS